jgi:hypothetical protein
MKNQYFLFISLFLVLSFSFLVGQETEITGKPGSQLWQTKLFDLDKDGMDDLFVFSKRSDGIYVQMGGSRLLEKIDLVDFQPDLFINSKGTNNILVDDLDGDDRNEIIVSSSIAAKVTIIPFEMWAENWVVYVNHPDNISITGDNLFGSSVAIGDFDGDGFRDLVIGQPYDWNYQGKVYVFKGRTQWPFNLCSHQYDLCEQAPNTSEVDYFGGSMGAGDIDGDGLDDLVIGAQDATRQNNKRGKAYLLSGVCNFFEDLQKEMETIEPGVGMDNFGSGIVVDDDVVLVGSYSVSTDSNKTITSSIHGFQSDQRFSFEIQGEGLITPMVYRDKLLVSESFRDSTTGAIHSVFLGDVDLSSHKPLFIGNNKYQGFGVTLSYGKIDGNDMADLVVGCFSPNGIEESDLEKLPGAIKIIYDFESCSQTKIENGVLSEFNLFQNYPNPFNPETVITYSISEPTHVELSVYNVRGQKVADLVNEHKDFGGHKQTFKAGNLTSGVYICQLKTDNNVETTRMVLMR